MLSNWSGCADLNRGPHGPKPCALPTALHPVRNLSYPLPQRCSALYAHYSMTIAMCQVLLVFSSLVTPFEHEEIPARREAAQGITADGPDIACAGAAGIR